MQRLSIPANRYGSLNCRNLVWVALVCWASTLRAQPTGYTEAPPPNLTVSATTTTNAYVNVPLWGTAANAAYIVSVTCLGRCTSGSCTAGTAVEVTRDLLATTNGSNVITLVTANSTGTDPIQSKGNLAGGTVNATNMACNMTSCGAALCNGATPVACATGVISVAVRSPAASSTMAWTCVGWLQNVGS